MQNSVISNVYCEMETMESSVSEKIVRREKLGNLVPGLDALTRANRA